MQGDCAITDYQKFIFDLKGWLVIPSVLDAGDIERIKAYLLRLRDDPSSIPEHERNTWAGPCQDLLDHPVLVDALRDLIGEDLGPDHRPTVDTAPPAESAAYAFRCDNSFHMIKAADEARARDPHNGGPAMGPTHNYQWVHGRMFSPSVRAVWELNAVPATGGGTVLISGSHKANHLMPPAEELDDALFESYTCPAGSLILFSENTCHGSATWTDPAQPRIAVFNHYTHYAMRFHVDVPDTRLIDAMPPLRRTLFRDVWTYHFGGRPPHPNNYDAPDNRAHSPRYPGW